MNGQSEINYYTGSSVQPEAIKAAFTGGDSYQDFFEATADELVDKLLESYKYLQMAHYRIGYLESLLDSCRQQASLIPDLQSQAGRAMELSKENSSLRQQMPQILAKVQRVKTLEVENQDLRNQLPTAPLYEGKVGDQDTFVLSAQLMKSEQIIKKWWPRFCCLILGGTENGAQRLSSNCSMEDYYAMLQHRIKK